MASNRRQLLANEIARLSEEGHSQRAISSALGIARKTVNKILIEQKARREQGESALTRHIGRPRLPKASKLDDNDEQIRSWLEQYPRLKATRCLEMLQAQGFHGEYTIVRERLRSLRQQVAPPPPAAVAQTTAGQRAEFDWSPYKLAEGLQVQTWSATLCWSRAGYLAGSPNSKQAAILALLARSFEQWRGVPRECVTDSMPGVVDRWECGQSILNARFVDFAAYYRFKVVIAPRACPKFKARVEGRDLSRPVIAAGKRGGSFWAR
ncbi:MAG: hypothetical protein HYV63_26245 [Candidatus Schekmanbacteria bacterium]|nr:hypothetical protein [Candidatus Schekmanbacteria bacterium]